ncbi:DUF4870 family protein [Piscinibacter koreensis]|uniref:Transmembrane protein n=1 Tax=Piscinibacter koreensis TaxID=2742824 RepID=A0A7Y6NMC6_9BURK|nr:hypothetical protein [Schlegelella koreensis]NUZ05729.1 hypothetical protein [Schlegelella koreensis]
MNEEIVELDPRQRSLRNIGHVSYLLHTIVAVGAVLPGVQASVLLLIAAFALDMFKRDDAVGSWQETHFRWRIRSVLWAGALYLVTAPLWLLLLVPGWIAWALISIWFLYRIIRGWINLTTQTAMPT